MKSAGCSIPITEDDINDSDNVEGKLGDLQDEYQAVSAALVRVIRVLTTIAKYLGVSSHSQGQR